MKIEDAERYFEHQGELARQMGLNSQSAIGNWKRQGRTLIPELYARRLAEKTKGRQRNGVVLRFSRSAYVERIAG